MASTHADASFSLRRVAVQACGPVLLFGLAEGAVLPVIPLSARELGASVPVAALAVGLVSVGAVTGNIPATLITTRHGERWTLVGAAAWAAAAIVLCAWSRNLALFALGCFMLGAAQAVFQLARQSYLTAVVPPAFRARAMSIFGGIARSGLFLGPLAAAAAIAPFGLAGGFGVALAALVLTAAVSAAVRDPQAQRGAPADHSEHEAPTLLSTLRSCRRVFLTVGLGVLLVSAVRAARPALIPLWSDHLALQASTASLIYGLGAGIELLVFYPAGQVMDTKGRRWVVVPSLLLMGAAMLLMPLTQASATLLAVSLLIGLGNGIGSGMVATIGADHSPRAGRAHFLGVWHLISDVGSASGPALLSLLAAALSLSAAIAATGVVALLAAAQLAYWIPRAASRPTAR